MRSLATISSVNMGTGAPTAELCGQTWLLYIFCRNQNSDISVVTLSSLFPPCRPKARDRCIRRLQTKKSSIFLDICKTQNLCFLSCRFLLCRSSPRLSLAPQCSSRNSRVLTQRRYISCSFPDAASALGNGRICVGKWAQRSRPVRRRVCITS